MNFTLPMASSSEVGCSVGCSTATRSFFSMCSSVVLPALSRPRNSSLACLFARPRFARTSQTRCAWSALMSFGLEEADMCAVWACCWLCCGVGVGGGVVLCLFLGVCFLDVLVVWRRQRVQRFCDAPSDVVAGVCTHVMDSSEDMGESLSTYT